ncbi:hypothetical protein PpBr36_08380 [Pyricularia pennisetigena]|uniref:hypothetical protein n=1 Tax=Pyricularia pennisetigena TaxID=1578925 RepID=UPI0011531795|nr:hypothetical protein PpBr36_08380 [Pyricularia pennisetigena]TLS24217.1 hypothetical protein PpBr36_08380 [Pyricularia pennisetigena]
MAEYGLMIDRDRGEKPKTRSWWREKLLNHQKPSLFASVDRRPSPLSSILPFVFCVFENELAASWQGHKPPRCGMLWAPCASMKAQRLAGIDDALQEEARAATKQQAVMPGKADKLGVMYVSYEKAQGSSRSKADQGARLICGTKSSICTEKVPSQTDYCTAVMKKVVLGKLGAGRKWMPRILVEECLFVLRIGE